MIATTATPEEELHSLYSRYKQLVLTTAATLILEAPVGDLDAEAEALLDDCRASHRGASILEPQFSACASAATELRQLLKTAELGAVTIDDIDSARAAHNLLRREVWRVLPFEYVPCCAEPNSHHHGRSA